MFKWRKDEERTELDAAWEDEAPKPYFAGAAAEGEAWDAAEDALEGEAQGAEGSGEGEAWGADDAAQGAFPEPNDFDLSGDDEPIDDEEREVVSDTPFDTEDSFAYDAESEEFTEGDATGFLDDSHTDFYEYGEEKHGVHDAPEVPEAAGVPESPAVVAGRAGVGRHGSGLTTKQAKLEAMPEHQKRSRRMRRWLILVALLLVALLGALGYFGWRLYQESLVAVEQETTDVTTEVEVAADTEEVTADTGSVSTKKTTVPNLLGLLGKTQSEAIAALGSGATVTLETEIADETSPMMQRSTVVLTEEPTDTKSGAPTVYLGLDTEGKVVIAGYSAATASLGYGTLSFVDVVTSQHVVEQTLGEAGLNLPEGSVVLPDSSKYSTYAADKTTLVKEQCTFDGEVNQDGKDYNWTSVLVYNYTAANATGNLADTVRQVYVYVSDKAAADAALEAKSKVLEERKAEEAKKAEEEAKAAEAAASSAAAEAAASSAPAEAAASTAE